MLHSLSSLEKFLSQRLHQPLPGASAHEAMRALSVGSVRPRFNHTTPPRPGSVMILIFENEGELFFPLIKRPEYAGAHGGQVSLPGGKAEAGEDVEQTALRETFEEIGIPPGEIKIVGRLSDFHVLPSNFLIVPVIGILHGRPQYIPDSYEVARVLTASLTSILEPDAHKQRDIIVADIYTLKAPHFEIDSEVVWGATAMILNELREILLEGGG